jgi:hypothetical protein
VGVWIFEENHFGKIQRRSLRYPRSLNHGETGSRSQPWSFKKRPYVCVCVEWFRVPQGPKESLQLSISNDPRPGGREALWREGGLHHM